MSRGRKRGNHERRRNEIAEAACKVFLRQGLARTSLANIAREMGSTTGVLGHYFADKEELLLCAKNLLFDRQYQRASQAAERCLGLEKIRAMATEFLPCGTETLNQYRLLAMFIGNAIGDLRLVETQRKRDERHSLLVAGVIRTLQREGIVPKKRNARLEAVGILAFVDGLAEHAIMRRKPFSCRALARLLNRYLSTLVQE